MAKKNLSHKRVKLLIFIGVVIYAGITFLNQQTLMTGQLDKQNGLLAKESQLKQQIEFSQNQLDYIGTDAYIIKEARERLGWMFSDETKYVKVPSAQPEETQPSGQPSAGASG